MIQSLVVSFEYKMELITDTFANDRAWLVSFGIFCCLLVCLFVCCQVSDTTISQINTKVLL